MANQFGETIVAESSPRGMGRGARRGMVRLSGEHALDAAATLIATAREQSRVLGFSTETQATAYDVLLRVWDDTCAPRVPSKILCWHRGRSFTGELLVEIHTVASPPVLQAIVRRLLTQPNVRLAERGEFTLRALTAGRLDLTQAEAILGVINATDTASLAAALRQLAGGLRRELDAVYQHLTNTLTDCEASLDFADEETTIVTRETLAAQIAKIHRELAALACRLTTNSSVSGDVPQVVLAGCANVGKSTLWNVLTAGDNLPRAIVSPIAGTTRDFLAAEIHETAITYCLVDTAGITASTDIINTESQQRAREVMAAATLVIHCIHCVTADDIGEISKPARTIRVVTKSDMLVAGQVIGSADAVVSAHTGDGIAALREIISERLLACCGTGDVVASTAIRAAAALSAAQESLNVAESVLTTLGDESLVADELRRAARAVGDLLGTSTTPDDILNNIFSRFCLGK